MADRDSGQARVGVGRETVAEEGRDRLVDALEDAAADGDAGQGGQHRLGGGLDVDGGVETGAAEHPFGEGDAVAGDDQAVQPGQGFGRAQRLGEAGRIEAGGLAARQEPRGRLAAPREGGEGEGGGQQGAAMHGEVSRGRVDGFRVRGSRTAGQAGKRTFRVSARGG